MNERIKELAQQAFIYSCEFAHDPDYSPHNPYNGLIEKERYDTKFAELIIQECVSVINTEAGEREDDEYERAWKMGTEFAVYQIKQHFGVEA